ncbi:MAG TPA: cytochrome c-type biogenesis protein [Burkholderiales bacterium]|nr:cytochrome c-type biogenesis protein [Burkholderiales bacterium]
MRALLALLVWCAAGAAFAQIGQQTEADKRLVDISAELRCLVCQNQTIAESNADLAVDLRRQIREQIADGRSDREIIQYMTDRYGDFVLYRPPFKATTVLLWLGPALLLIVGVLTLRRTLRQRRALMADAPLDEEARRRAEALLADNEEERNDT